MATLRWIGLLLIVIFCWTGLRPHFSAPPASPTTGHSTPSSSATIDALTQAERVADWLVQHQRLPDFYLTKAAARRQGWVPDKGNLCEVLPGHAIGGDRFSNREQQLPRQAGRQWYEADVNYRCGRRGADRLIYSSDGLIYLTRDHYRSFSKVH
ncbi:ribonuclease domain-containing protein [Pantoea sp. SIMBA_079]|uniref:ribonuclease domain-containing protein n=1 Tax=Pantoea TaxID=53335 RepID=UPI00080F592B|nr:MULTISPECIES: ribonuclease domain-containing protein [Pantoea]